MKGWLAANEENETEKLAHQNRLGNNVNGPRRTWTTEKSKERKKNDIDVLIS
jgi:hypothetical protein